jgi:DnaK suppressor protein
MNEHNLRVYHGGLDMSKPPFTAAFIKEQKEKLVHMKTHLMNEMREKVKTEITDTEKDISEEGDLAQSLTNQEIALKVHDQTIRKVREIEIALQKIEMGSYGICEETGDPIEKKRLERIPWARISVAAQEELEKERRHLKVG